MRPARRTGDNEDGRDGLGKWIAIGIAIGVAIGSMYGNIAIGVGIGVALGIGLASVERKGSPAGRASAPARGLRLS